MKFKLKKEFEAAQIFCKDKSGNEILITYADFNDYFAELMLANNQGHLVELNPMYEDMISDEKKTFQQVTEGVIALTYEPLPNDLQPQKAMPKKRGLRSDAGKPRTQKG